MADDSNIAYSSTQGIVAWSGGQVLLNYGQSIDKGHPLYQERSDLFQGLAPVSATDIQHNAPPGRVESGMQQPGAVRHTRVPANKTGSGQ